MDALGFLMGIARGERPDPRRLDDGAREAVATWLARPAGELARALGIDGATVARVVARVKEAGVVPRGDAELKPEPRKPGRPRGTPPPEMHARMLGALMGGARNGPRGLAGALRGDAQHDGRAARRTLAPGVLPDLDARLVDALAAEGVQTLDELAAADPLDLIGCAGLRYSNASKFVLLARREVAAATRAD